MTANEESASQADARALKPLISTVPKALRGQLLSDRVLKSKDKPLLESLLSAVEPDEVARSEVLDDMLAYGMALARCDVERFAAYRALLRARENHLAADIFDAMESFFRLDPMQSRHGFEAAAQRLVDLERLDEVLVHKKLKGILPFAHLLPAANDRALAAAPLTWMLEPHDWKKGPEDAFVFIAADARYIARFAKFYVESLSGCPLPVHIHCVGDVPPDFANWLKETRGGAAGLTSERVPAYPGTAYLTCARFLALPELLSYYECSALVTDIDAVWTEAPSAWLSSHRAALHDLGVPSEYFRLCEARAAGPASANEYCFLPLALPWRIASCNFLYFNNSAVGRAILRRYNNMIIFGMEQFVGARRMAPWYIDQTLLYSVLCEYFTSGALGYVRNKPIAYKIDGVSEPKDEILAALAKRVATRV